MTYDDVAARFGVTRCEACDRYNHKTGAWGSEPYEDKWNWVDVERGFYDRGQVPTAKAAPTRSRLAEEVMLWGRTCERR